MYQLCALDYPYKTNNFYEITQEILSDSVFPRIPEEYSEGLNQIIQKMLIRDYTKRPSASELLETEYFKSSLEHFFSEEINENESFVSKPFSKMSD